MGVYSEARIGNCLTIFTEEDNTGFIDTLGRNFREIKLPENDLNVVTVLASVQEAKA